MRHAYCGVRAKEQPTDSVTVEAVLNKTGESAPPFL